MKNYDLLLFGFGHVAQGLLALLEQWHADHPEGPRFRIVGIQTGRRGSVYKSSGLDLRELQGIGRGGSLADLRSGHGLERDLSERALLERDADFQLELGPGNLETGQPALDRCRDSLRQGRPVVLADKGPLVCGWTELQQLAQDYRAALRYEATVMAGTPCLRFLKDNLAGQRITRIEGLFSGSCSFILRKLEQGEGLESAVIQAKKEGYLEADPRADLLGWDTRSKLQILAAHIWGKVLAKEDLPVQGIEGLDPDRVQREAQAGRRLRLLGELRLRDGRPQGRVRLEALAVSDPLARLEGVQNGLRVSCEPLGSLLLCGPGAGDRVTASAVLLDLLDLTRV